MNVELCGIIREAVGLTNSLKEFSCDQDFFDEKKRKLCDVRRDFAILDARSMYPNSSLADLYDDLVMPADLRKAHQDNDRAVMVAYGFSVKNTTESSCVAALMELYQRLS